MKIKGMKRVFFWTRIDFFLQLADRKLFTMKQLIIPGIELWVINISLQIKLNRANKRFSTHARCVGTPEPIPDQIGNISIC